MIMASPEHQAFVRRVSNAGPNGYQLRQGEVGKACHLGAVGVLTVKANVAKVTREGRRALEFAA